MNVYNLISLEGDEVYVHEAITTIYLAAVFINKVLLEHSHVPLVT